MADGVNSLSNSQIQSNYEKYKEYFAKEDTSSLNQSDFLTLMVEQMKNQDFSNPTDNTEFIAQMAQFSALQAQQNMTRYAQATYATSLIGKKVNLGYSDTSGSYVTNSGLVTAVTMAKNEYSVVVDGKLYKLDEVLSVGMLTAEDVAGNDKTDDKTDSTDKTDKPEDTTEKTDDAKENTEVTA